MCEWKCSTWSMARRRRHGAAGGAAVNLVCVVEMQALKLWRWCRIGNARMSTSASQQRYAPLYATSIQQQQQQSRAQLPLLRRAATYLISRAGLASASLSQNPHWNDLKWQFAGDSRQLMGAVWASSSTHARPRPVVVMVKPSIQFIRGVDELTVPDISLTRSKDGLNGVATFIFDQPSVFDSSKELGDITGLYLIDDEGVLQSVDVSAKFLNGKPAKIEAKYLMKTLNEWDRFMRFMERYAAENNLGFVKK